MTTEYGQARFLRCIGEPTRLRILKLLTEGEKCVCEIVEDLGREQSLVSHHLSALRACNIVTARQEAQKVFYRLSSSSLVKLVLGIESVMTELPLCSGERSRRGGP